MKTMVRLALALAFVCGIAYVAQAGEAKEVTLKGDIACAHCTFKTEGVKDCQDALQVKDGGSTTTYFLTKNDTLTKFGHTCQGSKSVTVTGTVAEKDGQKWITPSKIEMAKG